MQLNRILTTHTGSLIRPPDVLAFLDAFERGEEVDESKWSEAMSQSVATIVREQADAGIDIVSDGEIGKVSWISYLYERLSGLEVRELPPGSIVMPPSRDRQMFPEFYAEEEKQFAHERAYEPEDRDEMDVREQCLLQQPSGAKGSAAVNPGGFTLADGCTFMIRIDLPAFPGLGKAYRSVKSRRASP